MSNPQLRDILLKPFNLIKNKPLQRIILAGGIFLVIYLLLALVVAPARVDVEVGRPSPQDIYATSDFVDEETTERQREEAAEQVSPVYVHQEEVTDEILKEVDYFFNALLEIQQEEEEEDRQDQLNELMDEYPNLIQSDVEALVEEEEEVIQELKESLRGDIKQVLEDGIKPEEEAEIREQLSALIRDYPYSQATLRMVEEFVYIVLEPNMALDEEATEEKREEAREEVEPVRIHRNTLIVSEGETVTQEHLAQLEALGMKRGGQPDYNTFLGLFLLLIILFGVVGIYLYVLDRKVYEDHSMWLLLGLIVIITLLFSIAAEFFSEYLIPVAIGIILMAVLFNNYLAMLMNLILALLVGLISDGDIGVVTMCLVGGLVAIYSVSRLSQRMDLAKAGLYVALANVLVIIAVFLLLGDLRLEYGVLREFGYSILAGVGSGIFSTVVAIGLLPFLESGFGLTTSVTLLELSNPNQPLLRKLLMKAPGTYHHSIMVANLAEAAAEEVEADPLLARVGSYYHDLGKINRPYFFSENQFSRENPHKKLSPNLSALIISSHVKDGVELAHQERLPGMLVDIIKQHHGTSKISFFYQQAMEEGRKDVVEESFRYEGPLPQTKEAAIIMLADAVEAGVRSLSRPVGGRIEGMVRKLIKDKLNDGQLDESDLTLKDLDKIGDTFVYILSSVYHHRIEYPEREIKKELGRK